MRRPSPGYAELGALSNFTFLEGASHPWELVKQAKALGHAAIGIADRNSFAGLVRGHVAAEEAGIPFVPGARVRLPDDVLCREAAGHLGPQVSIASLR